MADKPQCKSCGCVVGSANHDAYGWEKWYCMGDTYICSTCFNRRVPRRLIDT